MEIIDGACRKAGLRHEACSGRCGSVGQVEGAASRQTMALRFASPAGSTGQVLLSLFYTAKTGDIEVMNVTADG
jgi:hypothetical protein